MAEDRLTDKDLGLKIKGGGVSVLLENREEKNWSRNVIIDVSDRPEAKITNNVGSDTRVVLTGLSSEQKTAILNARDNNNVTTDGLSLDANKGIIGYVADSIIVGVGEKHLKPMPKIPTQSNYR